MKKLLIILLALLMFLTGCAPSAQGLVKPMTFYYLQQTFQYDSESGVIAAELRETADCADEIAILQRYFQGPVDPTLQCAFPEATELVALNIQEQSATVTLTDNIISLSGMDLTVACVCITKTVIAVTGVEQVTIKAQTQSLGDQGSVTMTLEDILLIDDSKIVIKPD